MRLLAHLLLVFNVQQQQPTGLKKILNQIPFPSQPNAATREQLNEKVLDLLQAAVEVGQAGSLTSEESQNRMAELADAVIPLSESKKPAQFPLIGEHTLLYSAAKGASSGRVFGNFVGKVTQFFEDDEIFYNRVAFGPLMIALKARREIKNDSIIKVSFLETKVTLFSKTLTQKEIEGGGVWKVRFVGEVEGVDGKRKLIRIMDTPSLFILEQPLD